jgi:hypothetical protein
MRICRSGIIVIAAIGLLAASPVLATEEIPLRACQSVVLSFDDLKPYVFFNSVELGPQVGMAYNWHGDHNNNLYVDCIFADIEAAVPQLVALTITQDGQVREVTIEQANEIIRRAFQ